MREILFRGKRISSGRWVYGGIMKTFHPNFESASVEDFLQQKTNCYCICAKGADVFVEQNTIGQFTGLTDKNGKKIFEGDFLNGFQYPFYRSESDEHNYFAEVIWFPGNCAFGIYTHKHPTAKVRGISAGNADFIEDFNSDDWEVIGNIHDNPELLEGGADN